MPERVCVDLVCVLCQRPIASDTLYACEIYDGEGTCWHAECPTEEQDA